jgi:putative copper export protein
LNLFRLVNHWIHLLSAIFWVGGLAFIYLLLVPTLKQTLSEQTAASVISAVYKKFTTITFVLIFVMFVTGGINIGMSRHGGTFPPQYFVLLGIKLFLVVIFMTVAWRNYIEVRHMSQQEHFTEVPFLLLSFILAVMIVSLAAGLRTLYPH